MFLAVTRGLAGGAITSPGNEANPERVQRPISRLSTSWFHANRQPNQQKTATTPSHILQNSRAEQYWSRRLFLFLRVNGRQRELRGWRVFPLHDHLQFLDDIGVAGGDVRLLRRIGLEVV